MVASFLNYRLDDFAPSGTYTDYRYTKGRGFLWLNIIFQILILGIRMS